MNPEKIIEIAFFPSNIFIIFGIIAIAYLMNDYYAYNNIMTLLTSTFVFIISTLLLKKRIQDENYLHFSVALIALFTFFLASYILPVSFKLFYAATSVFLLSITVFLIRIKWKISTHTASFISASTMLSIIDIKFLFLFLLAPVIMWSRIKRKVHNFKQVLVGALVGFSVPIILGIIIVVK